MPGAPTHPPNTLGAPNTRHPPTPRLQRLGPEGAATVEVYWRTRKLHVACCPSPKAEPEPEPDEPEPEPEPKSKSKPAGGSAMLAAFVKKHAPSEASKAAESSE